MGLNGCKGSGKNSGQYTQEIEQACHLRMNGADITDKLTEMADHYTTLWEIVKADADFTQASWLTSQNAVLRGLISKRDKGYTATVIYGKKLTMDEAISLQVKRVETYKVGL